MKKTEKIDLWKSSKIQLIAKINTQENQINMLESTIKDELYKIFMDKLEEPTEIARIKKENKRLREKVKTLKNLLRE